MNEAYRLSLKCAYSTQSPDKGYLDVREDIPEGEFCDKVFAWCDGLMGKYYHEELTHCKRLCAILVSLTIRVKSIETRI